MVSARYLLCKATLSLFIVSILWGVTLKICKCPFLIKHSFYLPIYLPISFLFYSKGCSPLLSLLTLMLRLPQFGLEGAPWRGWCEQLTCHHCPVSISLLYGSTSSSNLSWVSSPQPRIGHFTKELGFFLVTNGI